MRVFSANSHLKDAHTGKSRSFTEAHEYSGFPATRVFDTKVCTVESVSKRDATCGTKCLMLSWSQTASPEQVWRSVAAERLKGKRGFLTRKWEQLGWVFKLLSFKLSRGTEVCVAHNELYHDNALLTPNVLSVSKVDKEALDLQVKEKERLEEAEKEEQNAYGEFRKRCWVMSPEASFRERK